MLSKTTHGATKFLVEEVIAPCLCVIDVVYFGNDAEFEDIKQHELTKVCYDSHINQKFTRVAIFKNQ